jgi:hypothetical protein
VPTLLAKVNRVREAAAAVEAARVTAMLVAETSAQEATAVQDSATLHVKDAEDRATLVEREDLERVLRSKAKNTAALASTCEDAEGFVWKITLFEDELEVERQAREVSERERRE